MVILEDPNATVVKRYVHHDGWIGSPSVEASSKDPQQFLICIGGEDYYAQQEELNAEQATVLRDMLNAWLMQQ